MCLDYIPHENTEQSLQVNAEYTLGEQQWKSSKRLHLRSL